MRRTIPRLCGLVAIALLAFGAACASTSATPVGTRVYSPTPATESVAIYSSEREVPNPFVVVGILTHNDPGKYQILTLQDAIPSLTEKARSLGANAVIIDESRPVKSGIISTGIWVSARAIRVGP